MRKLFITDIHGELSGLKLLLQQAEVDVGCDQLVIGGDMINRGKDSAGVLKLLKALADRYPQQVHALIGNHEEMMGDYQRIGDKTWLSHGGRHTLENLSKQFPREAERQAHIDWAINLPLYYEDDQFVYTHAGLHPYEPLTRQSRGILWMTEAEFYRIPATELRKLTGNKPVVHGHTPVERICYDGVRLGVDLGCNTYSLQELRGLALVDLTNGWYWVYKQATRQVERRELPQL